MVAKPKPKARSARRKRDEPAVPSKPELVVGLVGAVGADLHAAADATAAALSPYGYTAVPIRISGLMREVKGAGLLKKPAPEDDRIWRHMDAGDLIRDQTGRNDAMAGLAIGWITEYRAAHFDALPATNTAFILDSLKHPAEVETMRRIYRDRFILISVHAPTDARLKALKKKISASREAPERPNAFTTDAELIMGRDEHDDEHGFGQNVREAFIKGHVYVSTHPKRDLATGISRYFRLFFGDPFETPTQDEYAMFQTHTAALRSADLSRQVGAAVCSAEGEIIAVGCNEVPKAKGGQYWPDSDPDVRDFVLGYDSNVKYRDAAFAEAFEKLKDEKQLMKSATLNRFKSALGGTRLANISEFGRTVHAEMAALLDAARRGAAVAGHQLFTTTFPCHNCARHIIGAGIKEVIYREPYEKSLASELHEDAITVDTTTGANGKVVFRRFTGVGPPQYQGLFTMRKRKDEAGNKVGWKEATAVPHLVTSASAYLTVEEDFLDEFREAMKNVDLKKGEISGNPNRLA